MDLMKEMRTFATPLHGRLDLAWEAEPFVARVTHDQADVGGDRCLLVSEPTELATGFGLCLVLGSETRDELIQELPLELSHMTDGDIIRVNPRRAEVWVMYRRHSRFNAMLLTERCNSWCVMCSQPPKPQNDDVLLDAWLRAIRLMSSETEELGITGGEPTLLGARLLDLVAECKQMLPQTGLHVLTNGRKFNYLSLARELSAIDHPDLMLGIPLYSDLAWHHDFVVQADNAFDQTLRGILNLARCGVRVEIRVVIHRYTFERLPALCEFIARNLPFVSHVALMGLEPIGFGKSNLDALWVDPIEYQRQLALAVEQLQNHGLHASIYNHQLCVLPEKLWPLARQSISDWKNIYLPECARCDLQQQCTGFFHSAATAHSRGIKPIKRQVQEPISP